MSKEKIAIKLGLLAASVALRIVAPGISEPVAASIDAVNFADPIG
jgi:hypothetical protein